MIFCFMELWVCSVEALGFSFGGFATTSFLNEGPCSSGATARATTIKLGVMVVRRESLDPKPPKTDRNHETLGPQNPNALQTQALNTLTTRSFEAKPAEVRISNWCRA